MENIFSGINMGDMLDQATIFIAGLSPYTTLIIGLFLAFFIISFIVSMIRGGKAETQIGFYDDDDFDDDY